MIDWLADYFPGITPYMDILQVLLPLTIAFIIFLVIFEFLKKQLLKKAKTKKQYSNVAAFLDLLKYIFAIFLVIIAFVSYADRWSELGFFAGLLTVAIGFALQKPISGVVAWLIIVTRRPFHIGDRVMISDIIGDITNINLTHIILDEIGGTIDGEEKSGRTVMIPTYRLFEENIINYTLLDDYILDEVSMMVTYESNLAHAERLIVDAVHSVMDSLWKAFPKKKQREPHTRLSFEDSGVTVIVRYMSLATNRNKITTDIRRELHKKVSNAKDVTFAYPHTEVLLSKKEKK
jgi:small-conductance mechanosensitive channel